MRYLLLLLIFIFPMFGYTQEVEPERDIASQRRMVKRKRPVKKQQIHKKETTRDEEASYEPREIRRPVQTLFFFGSFGYDLGGIIKFDNVHVSSTVTTIESDTYASFDVGGAIQVSGGYVFMPTNSFGFGGSIGYQVDRKIDSISLAGSNYPATGSFSLLLLEGNGVYRFDSIFIPVGINYVLPAYKKSSGDSGSTKMYGDIGVQVGIGYLLEGTNFFFQGNVKMIGVHAVKEASSTKYEFSKAYLTTLGGQVGYWF